VSQENVEVVKRATDAWNAGNADALRDLYDPDVIVRALEGWPEPGPYVGRDAVMRQWKQQREAFNTDALEVIGDYIDVGDRVVMRAIWRGVGAGPEADIELTALFTVRNGLILGTEFFWDHSEALKAVGLEE
jgi:ketosteroid isomerase-like protein